MLSISGESTWSHKGPRPGGAPAARGERKMEAPAELQSCTFEARAYPHGEKFCSAETCWVCNDGRWAEDRAVFVL